MSTRSAARSRRSLFATALVSTAVVVVVGAILVGTGPVLVAAAAYAALAGVVALVSMESLVGAVRRLWAADRAGLAGSYRDLTRSRALEQADFADAMAAKVSARQAEVERVLTELRSTERRRDQLGRELEQERQQRSALDARVETLRVELAASEAAEKQARADLATWQAEATRTA